MVSFLGLFVKLHLVALNRNEYGSIFTRLSVTVASERPVRVSFLFIRYGRISNKVGIVLTPHPQCTSWSVCPSKLEYIPGIKSRCAVDAVRPELTLRRHHAVMACASRDSRRSRAASICSP